MIVISSMVGPEFGPLRKGDPINLTCGNDRITGALFTSFEVKVREARHQRLKAPWRFGGHEPEAKG
jgi:hypothetical protein